MRIIPYTWFGRPWYDRSISKIAECTRDAFLWIAAWISFHFCTHGLSDVIVAKHEDHIRRANGCG